MNSLILKQLGFWFGLPVAVSLLTSAAFTAYFFTSVSTQLNAYTTPGMLLSQTAAIICIILLLLTCYFLSTWILFKRAADKER